MVHLISYDIKEYNKEDDAKVIAQLEEMGATRCLYSEWLLETAQSPKAVATEVMRSMKPGDRILVAALGSTAWNNLLNESKSKELLNRAVGR